MKQRNWYTDLKYKFGVRHNWSMPYCEFDMPILLWIMIVMNYIPTKTVLGFFFILSFFFIYYIHVVDRRLRYRVSSTVANNCKIYNSCACVSFKVTLSDAHYMYTTITTIQVHDPGTTLLVAGPNATRLEQQRWCT